MCVICVCAWNERIAAWNAYLSSCCTSLWGFRNLKGLNIPRANLATPSLIWFEPCECVWQRGQFISNLLQIFWANKILQLMMKSTKICSACLSNETEGRGFQLPYLFIYKSKKHSHQLQYDATRRPSNRNGKRAVFNSVYLHELKSNERQFPDYDFFCNNCSKNWLKHLGS